MKLNVANLHLQIDFVRIGCVHSHLGDKAGGFHSSRAAPMAVCPACL